MEQSTELNRPLKDGLSMADINVLGQTLENFLLTAKNAMFEPEGEKLAPHFNATQLAELCHKTQDQMGRLLEKAEEKGLPNGLSEENGKKRTRTFTLAEARQWIRAVGPGIGRKDGQPGAVLTIANFKGGVGKTVVSTTLAQGLTLRGYNVLCIDFDPQGSMTSLLGITPSYVPEQETVLPLMVSRTSDYASDTLQGCIRPTYWDGLDVIPASHALFAGEFYLPLRQLNARRSEPGFQFWEVLNLALNNGLRQHYDFILIDTPPALSYMTMTTFWAADALLLPLPPDGLDFASSAQFWSMLSDVASGTMGHASEEKKYSWVGVVPSKVDSTKMHTKEVLSWMKLSYKDLLMSTEIPETAAVRVGGVRMETVYDISKYVGAKKTLARAREAYDKLVDEVDFLTRTTLWK